MLEWLDKELLELEQVNGTAIILGHVPNLNECLTQYGKRLHAIMDRYQHVIRWSLYSHTHYEQYQVISDMIEKKPIGMTYVVGSATTYQGKPPSFAVMSVDPDTMLPVDYQVYAFDLDRANQKDEPSWSLKYDYRELYNLTDLSP